MSTASRKRSRSHEEEDERSTTDENGSADDFFAPLVAWVTARGGFVHAALQLAHRTLHTTAAISAGTVVMRIPAITVEDANPSLRMDDPVSALAWYLAQKPAAIQPYLASLPVEEHMDLPRLWPPSVVPQLLTGSPVLRYIQQSQQQLQRQYHQAATEQTSPQETTVSWEDYSRAHALVTSRAFQDDDDTCCMVPVLDLCNHSRGGGGSDTKNVAYTFVRDGGRMVEVTTTRDIAAGDALRITYGAKPNSVLLVNYGFALPPHSNIEPDGSSNDVLELYDDDTEAILMTVLRTGPPSYTYGCFTTALQSFYQDNEGETVTDHEYDNGLEDFLNEADDSEEDDDENDSADESYQDMLYTDSVPTNPKPTNASSSSSKAREVAALQKFRQHLFQRADTYTLPKQANWSALLRQVPEVEESMSRDIYAARLIASELRILQFYIWATERLEQRLVKVVIPAAPPLVVALDPDDIGTMDRHIAALMEVYMQLRH